jgi:hypothetical protein
MVLVEKLERKRRVVGFGEDTRMTLKWNLISYIYNYYESTCCKMLLYIILHILYNGTRLRH